MAQTRAYAIIGSVSVTTPAKKLCSTSGIWGRAKSFFYLDLGSLAPSPYVEPPLHGWEFCNLCKSIFFRNIL